MAHKIFLLILALFLTQASFSASKQNQPDACPNLAAIRIVGIQAASQDSTWGWMGYSINQYNTNVMWTFGVLLGGTVSNENEAIHQANADLLLLTSVEGPKKGDDTSPMQWVCAYSGDADSIAIAVTPPISNKLMSFLAKDKSIKYNANLRHG